MSFGKRSNVLTWMLIALIPVGAGLGFLIGWSIFRGGSAENITIDIKGSTTVEKIVTRTAIPFENTHPGVTVTIAGIGSGDGISALIDGQCDLAMASRPVKAEENTSAGNQLRAYAIARDGIGIIINDDANNLDISMDTARAIFNGTISSWSDPLISAAGLSGEISVTVREEGSGTRDTFNDIVMGDEDQAEAGSQYANDAIALDSNQLIYDEVSSNANAIGYVGLGYIDSDVLGVKIDSVEPSEDTVVDGTYPIARSLFLISNGELEHSSDDAKESVMWEYLNWHYSPEGQTGVEESGFIAIQKKKDDLL
jgi:phosphate transport system substrate-binding protein